MSVISDRPSRGGHKSRDGDMAVSYLQKRRACAERPYGRRIRRGTFA